MAISKTPNGGWRVFVKSGRVVVATKTFDLKRDAELWEAAQKRALDLGEFVDPRAGKELLGKALDRWHAQRSGTVASKTLNTEKYAIKHLEGLRKRTLSAVKSADLDALYGVMLQTLTRSTVVRFRQIASAFFSWCVKESLLSVNPALKSVVPRGTGQKPKREIWPLTLAELRGAYADAAARSMKDNADIILTLGLTGLRWGELAALRVRDVQELPCPALRVHRSKPDGQPVRTTKSGKSRTVPLVEEAAALLLPRLAGRKPDALIFPNASGGYRSNNNFKRDVHWSEVGKGRRIHDLRHTAATLWLASGVDLKTVQAWLGHSSAKLTADTYAHYLGSDADTAAVARLNAALGGTPGLRTPSRKRNLKAIG